MPLQVQTAVLTAIIVRGKADIRGILTDDLFNQPKFHLKLTLT